MVQSVVVVETTSKSCRGWLIGIKELGLESYSSHSCRDSIFTCEDLTFVMFQDILN